MGYNKKEVLGMQMEILWCLKIVTIVSKISTDYYIPNVNFVLSKLSPIVTSLALCANVMSVMQSTASCDGLGGQLAIELDKCLHEVILKGNPL